MCISYYQRISFLIQVNYFFFFFFFRRNLNVFKKHDFTPKLLSYVQMYIFKNLGEQWRFTIYQQLE